ncbi:MAG: c-type cytochrome [Burkholderiaceae bacterium]
MSSKPLKFAAIAVAAAAALAAGLVATVTVLSERKMHRTVEVTVAPVAYVGDAAAVGRGKYLFESRGCAGCHGADGTGRVFIDAPNGLYARAPNITAGPGSAVAAYGESDWVRTLRHGVKPDGRPLLIMPCEDYSRLTDADVAALVAYVRSLPPKAGVTAELRLPLIVKAAYAFGAVRDAAEKIDHTLPPSQPVPVAVSAEHGAYVASMCIGCHGPTLSGGRIPGAPPEWPAAANLTRGEDGVLARYDTPEKFIAMLRTGKRPDGSDVSRVMPFASLKTIDETDARAMHVYLKSLPPRRLGER